MRDGVENIIVVGTSAGGHYALTEIVKNLSIDIPAAIIIVMHMPIDSAIHLKEWLERFTQIPIVSLESSEPLRQRTIFIPPPGRSALCSTEGSVFVDPEIPDGSSTTINRLFASAAEVYQRRVIGVVLSGFLEDGTAGLRAVHEAGGITIVQDPAEAEFSSMPASAMENLTVTFCLHLSDIGAALELLVRRETEFETGLAVAVRALRTRASLLARLAEQSWRINPGTHQFLVKELVLLNRDLSSIEHLVREKLSKVSEPPGG